MGEEGELIDRVELGGRARQRGGDVAVIAHHHAFICRYLVHLGDDIGSGELGVRTFVPHDLQRGQALLGGAHIVGNHADRIVEMHDLVHAFDGQRRAVVDALQFAAQHRAGGDGADRHARHLHVDAVDRRAVDLLGRIEPLGRRADQLEVLGILERDLLRRRQRRRLVDQRAVGERAPGRLVDHLAVLGAAGVEIDTPLVRRGLDQHGPRRGARAAEGLVKRADRGRTAGHLKPHQWVGVELVARRRLCDPHLVEADLEFFRHQHRKGGEGPLTHLDLRDGDRDPAVAIDENESVGRKAVGGRASRRRDQRGEAEAQQQAAAGGRAGDQKRSARDAAVRRGLSGSSRC